MRTVVILSAARTPIGHFLGGLASIPAPRLGSIAIAEALRRAEVQKDQVDEAIVGNVLSAGLGQAPARQAALYAGLPVSVPATTINKMCGSGLKAAMLAAQAIAAGDADVVVAGGMENMSAAPYLLPRARTGYRLGDDKIVDTILKDGLLDAYQNLHMGNCAEILAREYRISRQDQDDFARRSYSRALGAMDGGKFAQEIVPVEISGAKGAPQLVAEDEEPRRVDFDKLSTLRPAFEEGGTVTAGNASSISDGAAAVVLAAEDVAQRRGGEPPGPQGGAAGGAGGPARGTTPPAPGTQHPLRQRGWRRKGRGVVC